MSLIEKSENGKKSMTEKVMEFDKPVACHASTNYRLVWNTIGYTLQREWHYSDGKKEWKDVETVITE